MRICLLRSFLFGTLMRVLSVFFQKEMFHTLLMMNRTVNSGTLSTKISQETRRMYETGSFSMGVTDQQGRTTIRKEAKNFYFFVKGGNDGMNKMRKESMFINLLQGLHPLEAEVVCLVKDKKLSDKYNITQDVVAEAYPDIQWGNRS
jgi:hypothetical protein